MATKKINKKMSFSEVVRTNPDSIGILFKHGMHCIGCGMAAMETLEEGAFAHGLDPDLLVEEINKSTEIKTDTKKAKNLKTKKKTNK